VAVYDHLPADGADDAPPSGLLTRIVRLNEARVLACDEASMAIAWYVW
jgi:hypothetical protein